MWLSGCYELERASSTNEVFRLNRLTGEVCVFGRGLARRNRIYVGQALHIPGESGRYAVQQGDTLEAIAKRYGVDVDQLHRANFPIDSIAPLEKAGCVR